MLQSIFFLRCSAVSSLQLNVLRERRVELMEKSRQHDRLIESLKEKQNNLDERRINLKELNTKLPIVEAELQVSESLINFSIYE